jgi:hypothetical protein
MYRNKERDMPITPFLRHQAFDPETIQVMSSAFVKVCTSLGLADRADPLTEIVAQHIIEAAQRGIRNETALFLSVLRDFKSDPQYGTVQPEMALEGLRGSARAVDE